MAVIYYILLSTEGETTASIFVRDSMLKIWNTDEKILYQYASENTPGSLKGVVVPMSGILADLIGDITDIQRGNSGTENCNISMADNEMMYVCSNSGKTNVAVTMLYDGVLKQFVEQIG